MSNNVRNLVVTGATSSLASSLVRTAAAKGVRQILAVSRSEFKCSKNDNLKCVKFVSGVDLSSESSFKVLEENAIKFFGSPFDVVHFAGDFWRHKPLIKTEYSEVVSMIHSHYLTLCGVAKFFTPLMINNKVGRLVAFSCNSVGYNYPDMSPFTCAKAAVEAFIKCYGNEYAPLGITSTAIALPTMRTSQVIKEKPNGDQINYIEPELLSSFILDNILPQPNIVTGNIVRIFRPSQTFYGSGYFERNPRKDEYKNAMRQP